MANSHDRRKLRRAAKLHVSEPSPISKEMPEAVPATKESSPLNIGDSLGLLALLLGVFLVIVTPPLYLKIPLLFALCIAVFLFTGHSHWTHRWPKVRQRLVAAGTALLLSIIAVPQFISQRKTGQPQQTPTAATVPPLANTIVNPEVSPKTSTTPEETIVATSKARSAKTTHSSRKKDENTPSAKIGVILNKGHIGRLNINNSHIQTTPDVGATFVDNQGEIKSTNIQNSGISVQKDPNKSEPEKKPVNNTK
jgi:hypothetical protein